MGDLKPVIEPATDVDVETLLARLTAIRAGYLDNINNANLATIPAISAARIGYLDNIDNANLATIDDISSLTATEIAHLNADIDSRAPANEYDTQLDANMSTRAPANEYDTQLDANMSTRAPSNEYDTAINKLAGESPTESSTTKNWKTVADSPDGTGGIVTTIGVAATRKKVHSLLLAVNALTAASAINVKLFIKINGTSRKVYEESFTVGTDPDGLWIINGTLGIHDVLTIVVYSNTDESVAIGYTVMTEAM